MKKLDITSKYCICFCAKHSYFIYMQKNKVYTDNVFHFLFKLSCIFLHVFVSKLVSHEVNVFLQR